MQIDTANFSIMLRDLANPMWGHGMGISREIRVSACALLALLTQPLLANETVTYSYDALGRLVATSTTGTVNNGQTVSTSFDPAGNRTNYTVTGASGAPVAPVVSIGNAMAIEGGSLNFPLSLTATSTSAISVTYSTSNGTALAGSDYMAVASGTATIPAGQTSATINIATVDDSVQESTEAMSVTISSPTGGATLGNSIGTGTINDNDATWTSTLTAATYQICDPTCYPYHGYFHDQAGSMSNTSYNGYTIDYLYDFNSNAAFLILSGSSVPPNSGWTSITLPGVGTLSRSAGNYIPDAYNNGKASMWIWYVPGTVTSGTVTIQ